MPVQPVPSNMPSMPSPAEAAFRRLTDEGVTWGDSSLWLPKLPSGVTPTSGSVDLFFTSPPYADARSYSRIHPDRYVEWFLPYGRATYHAAADTGSLVLNIKNRVAQS